MRETGAQKSQYPSLRNCLESAGACDLKSVRTRGEVYVVDAFKSVVARWLAKSTNSWAWNYVA